MKHAGVEVLPFVDQHRIVSVSFSWILGKDLVDYHVIIGRFLFLQGNRVPEYFFAKFEYREHLHSVLPKGDPLR